MMLRREWWITILSFVIVCIGGWGGYSIWYNVQLPWVRYNGNTFVKTSERWNTIQFQDKEGSQYTPASPPEFIHGGMVYLPVVKPIPGNTAPTVVFTIFVLKRYGHFTLYQEKQ